jgi:undecaprenyl-diphosphatase
MSAARTDVPRRSRWRLLIDAMVWLGRHELATLVMLTVVAGGVWLFVELGQHVTSGGTRSVDERLLLLLRNPADRSDPIGPDWLEEVMRDFTALGGVGVQAFLTAAVACFLLLERKTHAVLLILAAVGGALLISLVLKHEYDRPRPDLVPYGSLVVTRSFPSGHSALSAATYLTLGALLARVQPRRRMKAFALVAAAILAGLTGVSRVYLGVHWPSDVLAGWTLGAAWALFCWIVARLLQRRGQVEGDEPDVYGLA